MLIDIAAVGIGLLDRGSRDQPTFRPAVPLSQRVVIRVEEIGVLRMKGLVTWQRGQEEKGLQNPVPLGIMQFGRLDIWIRRRDLTFVTRGSPTCLVKWAKALCLPLKNP